MYSCQGPAFLVVQQLHILYLTPESQQMLFKALILGSSFCSQPMHVRTSRQAAMLTCSSKQQNLQSQFKTNHSLLPVVQSGDDADGASGVGSSEDPARAAR